MDQSPHKVAHVITDKNGEKVLVDPEESLNSVMLWFWPRLLATGPPT